MKTLLLILTSLLAYAQPTRCTNQPCSFATNFSADLKGDPDTRPDTWGTAGYVIKQIKFNVPVGYRVTILKVYGDFLIWPIGNVPKGKFAGALLGLSNTNPDGSVMVDWGADNCFLYVQVATGGKPERVPINFDTSAGGTLAPDNILSLKMAVWLNDTDLPIHMEPSLTIVYKFNKEQLNDY